MQTEQSMIRNVLGRAREWRGRKERRAIAAMPTLEQIEIDHIERVLGETDGNITHTAELLGIDRRTLYRKIEKYAQQQQASAK